MDEAERITELERQLAELRAANAVLAVKLGTVMDEQKAQETRQQRLAAIVEASRDAIWSWETDGTITFWNEEAERLLQYTADEMVGRSLLALVPPERLEPAQEAMAKLRDGGWIGQFETVRLRKDGTAIDVEMTVSPIRNARGEIIGAATVCRDITARRQSETKQQLLLGELDHRVKNTVATVLALMHQIQRSSANTKDFVRSFELRLRTLVRAHDALMKNDLLGARLEDLVEAELKAFCPEGSAAVVAEGDSILLHWRSAQMVCLAIHELAANAARHGALSVEGGKVRLVWHIEPGGTEPLIRLEWREEKGPPIRATPSRCGFGRTLLERGLPAALHGSATLDFTTGGLNYVLLFPLTLNVPDETQRLSSRASSSPSDCPVA